MHIELWPDNRDKALKMTKALGAPNKFLNEFFDAVDPGSFMNSMQQLLREEHAHLKITVEKVNINQSKKE